MLRNIKLIMFYGFLVFGHDNLLGMYSNIKNSYCIFCPLITIEYTKSFYAIKIVFRHFEPLSIITYEKKRNITYNFLFGASGKPIFNICCTWCISSEGV